MKFIKKPVTVEAVKWTGTNEEEIKKFVGLNAIFQYYVTKDNKNLVTSEKPSEEHTTSLEINTLEGKMQANIGDYIIRGVKGEYYPCKPDIFEQTYEEVKPSTYISRMYDELDELVDKFEKCTIFVDSEKFRDTVKEEYPAFLLWLQRNIMKRYIQTLSCRINISDNISQNVLIHQMSFGIAIQALKFGLAIRRKGWNGKGLFVIKQVPAHIDGNIIPKMQSLPQSAKDLIMKGKGFIDYTSQCLIYNENTGRADSWVPSISDVFAEDWELVL